MGTLYSTLGLIGLLLYAVVAAGFYTSIQQRWDRAGFKNITWTRLDILLGVITLPLSLMVATVAVPFIVVGGILLLLVSLTKPEVWVDKVELFFYKIERKFKKWKRKNTFMQKLMKPVGKKEVN